MKCPVCGAAELNHDAGDLPYNANGLLDIYIQHALPAGHKD